VPLQAGIMLLLHMHTPLPLHDWPEPHALPHPPQLFMSLSKLGHPNDDACGKDISVNRDHFGGSPGQGRQRKHSQQSARSTTYHSRRVRPTHHVDRLASYDAFLARRLLWS
jgi:hypothetical protein